MIMALLIFTGCSKTEVNEKAKNSNILESYISEEYNIEINYPADWYLYDHKKGDTNLGGINVSPVTEKNIFKKASPLLNLTRMGGNEINEEEVLSRRERLADTWNKITLDGNSDVSVKIKESKIVVDGIEMLRAEFENIKMFALDDDPKTDDYVLGSGVYYYFAYDNRLYFIKSVYPKTSPEYKSTLEKIVLQMKFKNK